MANIWQVDCDGRLFNSDRSLRLSPPDSEGDVEVEDWSSGSGYAHSFIPIESLAAFVDHHRGAPLRPWHYVTEKLPETYVAVLFWLAVVGEAPEKHVEGWYDPRHGYFVARSSGMRYRPSPGEAYAWQLLPDVPPLPEDAL